MPILRNAARPTFGTHASKLSRSEQAFLTSGQREVRRAHFCSRRRCLASGCALPRRPYALDHFGIASFVTEKLADPAVPRPYVHETLLEALYAIASQASCTVFTSVTDVDHLALGDIVRVAGDFLKQLKATRGMILNSG